MFLCVGSLFSCANYDQIIEFDPNFYVPRSAERYIIDRHSNIVYFVDPKIDKFACLHKDKVIELRDLLRNSRTKGLDFLETSLSEENLSKIDRILYLWEDNMQKLINRIND